MTSPAGRSDASAECSIRCMSLLAYESELKMRRAVPSLAAGALRLSRTFAVAATLSLCFLATSPVLAEPARSPDGSVQRCGEDTASRERCEHAWGRVERNLSALTEPNVCARDRESCQSNDGHAVRPPRPPYWIGHHYSGL